MAYRKFKADRLFDGEKMRKGVLVCDATGRIETILPDAPDAEYHEGLLCPGFVNTHCHLELSHMAGLIPPGTGMVDFLLQVMNRRDEAPLNPQDAAREADQVMYEEGIVAVGDISNNISTLPVKAASLLHYHTFVEVAGFVPAAASARLHQARQVYDAMNRVLGGVSLVPHAPYSVSKPLFEALNLPGLTSIHNQESSAENEFYRTGRGDFRRLYDALGLNLDFFSPYGTSSLAAYLPWLSAPASLLLVHNVATSAEDVALARALSTERNQRLYWCLCPGANQYIQDALPPLSILREQGCVMTLGTDSLASNHRLSILHEIGLIQEFFPQVPLGEVLGWATINGARALRLDGDLGAFLPGTLPGINLITGMAGDKITGSSRVRRLL